MQKYEKQGAFPYFLTLKTGCFPRGLVQCPSIYRKLTIPQQFMHNGASKRKHATCTRTLHPSPRLARTSAWQSGYFGASKS